MSLCCRIELLTQYSQSNLELYIIIDMTLSIIITIDMIVLNFLDQSILIDTHCLLVIRSWSTLMILESWTHNSFLSPMSWRAHWDTCQCCTIRTWLRARIWSWRFWQSPVTYGCDCQIRSRQSLVYPKVLIAQFPKDVRYLRSWLLGWSPNKVVLLVVVRNHDWCLAWHVLVTCDILAWLDLLLATTC